MATTRRTAVMGAMAAMVPASTASANPALIATLRRLIEAVIAAGDMNDLGDIVSDDVTLPDYDIVGIDNFRAASISGHEYRQSNYIDYRFKIITITGNDEWAMAYVRLIGTTSAGRSEDRAVFYAARIDDGRIAELYF